MVGKIDKMHPLGDLFVCVHMIRNTWPTVGMVNGHGYITWPTKDTIFDAEDSTKRF